MSDEWFGSVDEYANTGSVTDKGDTCVYNKERHEIVITVKLHDEFDAQDEIIKSFFSKKKKINVSAWNVISTTEEDRVLPRVEFFHLFDHEKLTVEEVHERFMTLGCKINFVEQDNRSFLATVERENRQGSCDILHRYQETLLRVLSEHDVSTLTIADVVRGRRNVHHGAYVNKQMADRREDLHTRYMELFQQYVSCMHEACKYTSAESSDVKYEEWKFMYPPIVQCRYCDSKDLVSTPDNRTVECQVCHMYQRLNGNSSIFQQQKLPEQQLTSQVDIPKLMNRHREFEKRKTVNVPMTLREYEAQHCEGLHIAARMGYEHGKHVSDVITNRKKHQKSCLWRVSTRDGYNDF